MNKLLADFNLEDIPSKPRLSEKYNIRLVNDPVLEKKHARIGMDIRFRIPEYKDNALSILVEPIGKTFPVFAFSFFEINAENGALCRFWHYQEPRKLVRITLSDLIGKDAGQILTPGYVVFEEDDDARELGNFYNEVASQLNELYRNRAFIEIRGETRVKKKVLEMQEIPLEGKKRFVKEELIGGVNDSTPTSLEYAKTHGYIEVNNIYNYYTLGKVLFKEELLSLYRKYANI